MGAFEGAWVEREGPHCGRPACRPSDRDTNADGTFDERLYAVQDANWNVVALVDTTGAVVERYATDPFGSVTVYSPTYTVRTGGSLYGWVINHQGMRYDGVAGLYYQRARWLSPTLGRWTTTDPMMFQAGDNNFYRFVGNNPVNSLDPSGLDEYNPYSQHWHHLYPKQVFENLTTGVDINAAENGFILFAKDHIGEGGIHPTGWNKDWIKWVQEQQDANLPINKDTMKAQLDKMMGSDKYKSILANGKVAKASYGEWATKAAAKIAAKKAAKSGCKAVAKKWSKKIPFVGAGLTVHFYGQDIQAKGFVGGTANSALDAIPYVGIGKGIIELGTGDWISDIEEIEDGGDE